MDLASARILTGDIARLAGCCEKAPSAPPEPEADPRPSDCHQMSTAEAKEHQP